MASIFIVDDSETVREKLKTVLSEEGHEVTEAMNGSHALKKLSTNASKIDLMIVDVNMPVMGGLDFIEATSKNSTYKNIPVIMLTTESHAKMVLRAKRTNVVRAWMIKPFEKDKLIPLVDKILESEGQKAAS